MNQTRYTKAIIEKTGEEIKEHEVLNLLNRPNPLRTREEFLFEYYVFKSVFGNAFYIRD